MPTVNYLLVIGCERDTANWNESYRKDYQNSKIKLMKAYQHRVHNIYDISF